MGLLSKFWSPTSALEEGFPNNKTEFTSCWEFTFTVVQYFWKSIANSNVTVSKWQGERKQGPEHNGIKIIINQEKS